MIEKIFAQESKIAASRPVSKTVQRGFESLLSCQIREMTQAERDNLKAYYRKRREMKTSSSKSSSSSKCCGSTLEG